MSLHEANQFIVLRGRVFNILDVAAKHNNTEHNNNKATTVLWAPSSGVLWGPETRCPYMGSTGLWAPSAPGGGGRPTPTPTPTPPRQKKSPPQYYRKAWLVVFWSCEMVWLPLLRDLSVVLLPIILANAELPTRPKLARLFHERCPQDCSTPALSPGPTLPAPPPSLDSCAELCVRGK